VRGLEPEVQRLMARHANEIADIENERDRRLAALERELNQRHSQSIREHRQAWEEEQQDAWHRERQMLSQRFTSVQSNESLASSVWIAPSILGTFLVFRNTFCSFWFYHLCGTFLFIIVASGFRELFQFMGTFFFTLKCLHFVVLGTFFISFCFRHQESQLLSQGFTVVK
jgi:hypothetical protein